MKNDPFSILYPSVPDTMIPDTLALYSALLPIYGPVLAWYELDRIIKTLYGENKNEME